MCSLYRLDAPAHDIAAIFDADPGADPWVGGYVAPGRFGPVVVGGRNGRRVLTPRLWGVPPPPAGNRPVTNVRNLKSPFWLGTLKHTEFRCLVPVTRFQEWGGQKGARSQQWFSIPSEPVFAFAGIWRDSEILSFAFLTTEPNSLAEPVHAKSMPMILQPEDYDIWLRADWKDAQQLVSPFPSQLMIMETQAASQRVNS
jgi:putative SOS response-associated peptidase YedK